MTTEKVKYGVHSEAGKLRKVMVCSPGLAHQRLTPNNCDELLFDDVLWVAQAKRDERWERREMAREVLVTARLTEQQDRARQECLNFALPDAEDNDETPEAVQPHLSLGTRPAKKGAMKK